MRTQHITAVLAAFCAFAAAPALAEAEPVLPVDQYVKYAKALNSAAPEDSTNVVKTTVAEVVQAAGDKAQQAVGEIADALAADSTVKADADDPAASGLFENVVAAAAAAGSDKAESLSMAKIAAAAGALVSGGADYVAGAGAGLAKGVSKEVKAALENVKDALADVDAYAIKSVYDSALTALRGGSYQMKEDSDAIGFAAAETAQDIRSDGVYVGSEEPAVVTPVVVPSQKKPKKNPTETQQR